VLTEAEQERKRIADWLRWSPGQENEDLCDALAAEMRKQRKAGMFAGHRYLELFAAAIERGDHLK